MIFIFFPLELVYSVLSIFYCTAKWPSNTHIYVHSFSNILHHASSQVTRYSSQCHKAGSHCLSIPINAVVRISYPQIPSPSHSLPLPLGSHKSILQDHEFLFCGKVYLCCILDSRYVISYGICLCLSDLLHLVWESLVPSMLLQMAIFCSFYVWVVFHCVYIHHIFLIQSSVNGHLGCFYVLAIVHSAATNMRVHVSF